MNFVAFEKRKTLGYFLDSLFSRLKKAPFSCESELCILKMEVLVFGCSSVQVLTVTHKKLSLYRSGQALSAPEGCASRTDNRHMKVSCLSALRSSHFCYTLSRCQGCSEARRIK